jgi:hypothetical protein
MYLSKCRLVSVYKLFCRTQTNVANNIVGSNVELCCLCRCIAIVRFDTISWRQMTSTTHGNVLVSTANHFLLQKTVGFVKQNRFRWHTAVSSLVRFVYDALCEQFMQIAVNLITDSARGTSSRMLPKLCENNY